MVTSKERTGSKSGAIALLFSSAVMLFVLLFGGTAAADEAATTANAGAAGANTGGNTAGGNGSANGANSNQKANATGGDDAVAPNSGSSSNQSNGSANVTTGDANATGNSATNNTQQTVVQGHNGVVVISDQNATIFNGGAAFANTGGNVAVGNGSTNNANVNQGATSVGANGDSVATNDATVRNDSNGDARVTTGDATATGSTSNNTIHQSNSIDCSTCLGVVVLGDQNASIVNVGLAVANTGGNAAVGNASQNNAVVGQLSTAKSTGGGDSVAANTATASNDSNGSAGIITGDATAVGNVATNNVAQVTNINAPNAKGVIVLSDQNANVANVGIGIANTGLNTAVGNLSTSTSKAIQGAVSGAGPPADDNVASNDAIVSNDSNGSASINTGNAHAGGNSSTTNLTQALNVNTNGKTLVLSDQNASVINFGIAASNTGLNAGVGNASVNRAHVPAKATSQNNGALGGDNVAANFGTAANTSNGSASITTGNASAAGNDSTTNASQAVNVNGNGGLVLPDQNALVVNAGIGIANTGGNIAAGNVSRSTATSNQRALAVNNADDSVASNFGEASTTSDGSASISTGNADSIGNYSAATTNIAQTVDTNGARQVVSDQSANVVDLGIGVSNTGLNVAIGNASRAETVTRQNARVVPARGDAVASNFGEASIDSDGSASITTGNANAVGSSARTNISQSVDADGADGFLLSDQTASSVNVGVAVANTGLNLAVGNAAQFSVALVAQHAAVLNGNIDDAVAANFGTAELTSNGSARIHTGDAIAVGTRSHTNIAQAANKGGEGFALVDQAANAGSIGLALANTGGNIALGNVSESFAATRQLARLPHADFPNADDLVASNDGVASIDSNGSAEIRTGNASAVGNESGSTTNISQTSDVNGAGFALVDQSASVLNVGVAVANSGLNLAVGNASQNQVASVQDAAILEQGAGNINADDLVASNNATTSNNSNGSASVTTGAANAVGNAATTNIAQTSDFNGKRFTLVDQSASVANVGLAAANSGLNVAVGNASRNNARSDQVARIRETGAGAGSINADDVVATNNADTANNSNGSASITTGSAAALGSISTTNVNQVADTNVSGSGFSLNDQVAEVVNIGAGIANSGGNAAVGNLSTNTARTAQDAQVRESGAGNLNADDVVAVNTSTNTNDSNGSASITTGWTDAVGNKATSNINQVADSSFAGNGFVLNDQAALVVNAGLGVSNSGLNIAIGNGSTNNARRAVDQTAAVTEVGAGNLNAEDVVASNTSDSGNTSDGSARITTGPAHGIGNDSTSAVNQVSDTNIAGTGFALVDQEMTVANVGASIANSGLNLAAGNVSQNNVATDQSARVDEAGAGNLNTEDVVAANTVTAWNQSDGSAEINTGNAHGTGNNSQTYVNQTADNDITKGFELVDQSGLVVNAGLAVSNSGLNLALGNASQNTTNAPQNARIREAGAGNLAIDGDAVASNTQDLSNTSDGSASITTGCSCANGNISITHVNADGDGDVEVFNVGAAVSNSGLNIAIGNASNNVVNSQSTARLSENGAGNLNANDDVVVANTSTAMNWSRGSASIDTGDTTSHGNTSTTIASGDALVVNLGIGIANSGLNVGVGNASTNTINSSVTAGVVENGAGNLNLGDDGVASNVLTEVNDSNGTADITTGDAYALGNRSATGIVDGEDATIINFGLAFANSGLNIGAGNTSVNKTNHVANATAPGGVSSNVADVSNLSDGRADIRTGNAYAFGNIASNAVCQGVDFGPSCPQPVLPPLPPGSCRCDQGTNNPPTTPPVNPPVPTPPTTPVTPGKPVTPVLARTGVSVEGLALLGLLLLAIGVFLRRKARTA